LLREAMAIRGKGNLGSYDRLFPSQDLLPAGGVGNLIALPLFRSARDRNATVFLNLESLEPHQDQWLYLSTLGRMTPKDVSRAADKAGRLPAGSEVTRLTAPVSTKIRPEAATVVRARLGAGIRVELADLTPALAASLLGARSPDLLRPTQHSRRGAGADVTNLEVILVRCPSIVQANSAAVATRSWPKPSAHYAALCGC
jgi:hypothetical protein